MLQKIVGVLNLAPDSFSDGRTYSITQLRERIQYLISSGADSIDVGAESTAPGSEPITAHEELLRLGDFFSIMTEFSDDVVFSLDTKKSTIAKIGIDHGVRMINDVSGGRNDPDIIRVIAGHPSVSYCIMYCKNTSGHADRSPDKNPSDIMANITGFFDGALPSLYEQGISKDQLIIDPGMGAFISTDYKDSIHVLRSIPDLKARYHLPILIGTSRKGFLGNISPDRGPTDRLASSLVSSIFALDQGADYVRVHEVYEMRQGLSVWQALRNI